MTLKPAYGFTLIEVLVALTVMAIGVAGNYALAIHSLQQFSLGFQQSQAVTVVRSVAAEIRSGGGLRDNLIPACDAGNQRACAIQNWRLQSIERWQQIAQRRLPSATLTVTQQTGRTRATLSWRPVGAIHPAQYSLDVAHE
ncbi:MAG: prepilin-type N-terminal cleavage/methylation domain-containing protein [Woeseiaceae bacterium]